MMAEGSMKLSELLARVGGTLKREFPGTQWIMAEILELHVNRSGHCYLELVEKNPGNDAILARARATIWASRYGMLRPYFETTTGTTLKSGIKLLFKGSVEFHAQYGFSINITDIDPAYTLGDLARKKQEVIRKLREEGVMEMNRELPFPPVPQRIAIISSETAAGYGDFLQSVADNSHGFIFNTLLFPAVLQGDEAPGSMIAAMDKVFDTIDDFDCVVIIRGGGSRADLECFNSYDLAYYITQFPLPVITGIGHERDESVADMVASRGLKTPTAVAEFLVDQLLAFEFRLSEYHEALAAVVNRTVQEQGFLLQRMAVNLSHKTGDFCRKKAEWLERAGQELRRSATLLIEKKREQISFLETRTGLVNPENVLKRGYSMTMHMGKTISDIKGVGKGDLLETRLYSGNVISTVDKTIKKS